MHEHDENRDAQSAEFNCVEVVKCSVSSAIQTGFNVAALMKRCQNCKHGFQNV